MQWIRSQSLRCLVLGLVVLMAPRPAAAQLAPTGGHYAGRASDTGYEPGTVNMSGGYAASVPLDLPAARGGLPVPLQIVSGARGVGAAGVGWDVPLSYVRRDMSFAGRRPAMGSDRTPLGREQVSLSLQGQRFELVRKGPTWVARHNAPEPSLREQNGTWVLFDGQGRTYVFVAPPALAGADVWLLSTVSGAGGTQVQLDYDIAWPALTGGSGLAIDLVRVRYNTHPTMGCAKHEVTLTYGDVAASPLALSMLGDRVLARMRTLKWVDVLSRASCGGAAERLRQQENRGQTGIFWLPAGHTASCLAAGALAMRGVAPGGIRSTGGAFPMVLWQNSVCISYTQQAINTSGIPDFGLARNYPSLLR